MEKQVSTTIPSPWGDLKVIAYARDGEDRMPHLAIYNPVVPLTEPVLVRIHSECLTGDLLRSKRCDCGDQLDKSLQMINENGGLLIYLRQEGRGIGLINKLKAYNLQDQGYNTVDANHQLGFETDERSYEIGTYILKDMGISKIKLLTNNPEKIESVINGGIEVIERVPLKIEPIKENKNYLQTKKDVLGHLLD